MLSSVRPRPLPDRYSFASNGCVTCLALRFLMLALRQYRRRRREYGGHTVWVMCAPEIEAVLTR